MLMLLIPHVCCKMFYLMVLQEPGAAGVAAWWSRAAEVWTPDELLLAAGAVVVARLRAAVAAQLGFSCSAGIAHSKILAKLGSGAQEPPNCCA
jgi:DNA polymerase eta